ncbi:aminotransferase class III-fold pyridoxal phosphate-dependent enzyme [Kitasatospora sp. NPDC006697]|uniref:aminotransferase class III-fold pyridoxal phosphate-dependent enzyme n=1 Tax=Kitasatospora sp. NPDC006697 TaxID=3364020 RepID=UPI0036948ADF
MPNQALSATVPAAGAHAAALARARNSTASEKWDLNHRFPIVMERASGVHVWDVGGRRYTDFTSCSGAAPLGAGFAPVVERVSAELARTGGILPGPLSLQRVEVAERLAEVFPCAERSIFFRTGSCATTAAVRLARVHTGARLVLTSGYHGWHDWQLQYRPELALPDRDPDTVDFGYDLDRLDSLARAADRVAAVIVTPEVNFYPPEYIRQLETIARSRGALVIVDEVMTGFRYAWRGYHCAAGLEPDLITLSKGLANGMALSAVAGRSAVVRADELTYLGNTYQREVTPFAAALATLDAYADGAAMARMRGVGTLLIEGLNEVFERSGVDAWARSWPTMFDVLFGDRELGHLFFQEMWDRGFLMQYGGRFMPSSATSNADIGAALAAAPEALATAQEKRGAGTAAGAPVAAEDAAVTFAADAFGATEHSVRQWFVPQTGPHRTGRARR